MIPSSSIRTICGGWLAAMVLASLSGPVLAQHFQTPLEHIAGDAILETRDGQKVEGFVRRWKSSFKKGELRLAGIARIQIKEKSGEKRWYDAEEIARLSVKLDVLQKILIFNEHTTSLKSFIEAIKSDFDELAEREYTIIESVEVKPGIFRLYQLLNPGFDSKIKVYYLSTGMMREPKDFKGGVDLDGHVMTSPYLAVMGVYKVGQGYVRVTKEKYRKRFFQELYGDCELMSRYPDEDRRFKYFAEHVFVYDQGCD